jgi:UDP-glucose 4-epimerase
VNILITGGLGFVGINLVRRFAQDLPQAHIIAADILPLNAGVDSFLSPFMDRISIHNLDVRDRNALIGLCEAEKVTQMVHAAAITPTTQKEIQQPDLIIDVNLGGAVNALCALSAMASMEKLILCSSTGVYTPLPPSDGTKISEDSALALDNLYSITKYSTELLGQRMQELVGKPVTSVRFASVYGSLERPTGARQHMSLMYRLKMALKNKQAVRVFGPDITRDWIHTSDLSRAMLNLLQAPAWNFPVYNLGSGKTTSLSDLMLAFSHYGLDIDWVNNPEDASLLFNQHDYRGALDITRIKRDAHFSPQIDPVIHMQDYLNEP